ncbi:MAG: hypothetical protein L6Q98_24940 [Anaerolineae bacterium]|nr:hypothetical protein [Anaerolineae bacterium]NUQ07127.1 hypothetical protein [Anaerolineae bacterium]
MLQDREQRKRLIGGVAVIALGIMTLVNATIVGDAAAWMWIIGLAVAAVVFTWVYTLERELWAVICAYVTGASAVVIFAASQVKPEGLWMPVIVLLGVAIPFFAAWWTHRSQWGFLLVAYILAAITGVVFLSERQPDGDGGLVPGYTLLMIGLPFIAAYFTTHQRELLIPGGILWFIGLAFLGTGLGLSQQLITVVVPLAVVAIGVYMLFGAYLTRTHEHLPK